MSLNKTLDRFFDEIRREAKRNPDFADRLDAVLQRHDSRREVSEDVMAEVAQSSPANGGGPSAARGAGKPTSKAGAAPPPQPSVPTAAPQALNPAGLYKKEGE